MWSFLLSKLGGSVLGSVLAPFRLYLVGAAVAGLVAWAGVHYVTDIKRNARLALLEGENAELGAANQQAENAVASLNARIREYNRQKLADIATANARVKQAKAEADQVRAARDLISAELAQTKFTILELMRDDENYADWIYSDTPADVWLQLDAAKNGIQPD